MIVVKLTCFISPFLVIDVWWLQCKKHQLNSHNESEDFLSIKIMSCAFTCIIRPDLVEKRSAKSSDLSRFFCEAVGCIEPSKLSRWSRIYTLELQFNSDPMPLSKRDKEEFSA